MSLFPVYSPTSQEPLEQSFLSSAVLTPNGTVFTYSSVSLGAAAADRYILVGTSGAAAGIGATVVSSLTIGGVTATELVTLDHRVDDGQYHSGFFGATVPTGTSGDIVVTWTATMSQNGIGVWRLTGANTTPHDSATDPLPAGGLTVDVDVEAGGAIFGYCSTDATAAGRFIWTGLTEDFDEVVDGDWDHSGASADFASAVTNQTVTVTGEGTSRPGLIGISFSPA